MAEEKPINKKDFQELLDGQTKAILNAVDKKIDEKIDEKIDGLAIMMKNAFQSNQEYMEKNFDAIEGNFKEVKQQIDNISKNTVDVIHQEEFDKLEDRVAT